MRATLPRIFQAPFSTLLFRSSFLGEDFLSNLPPPRKLLFALGLGLLFGASFELRYQVGFLVASVYTYWLFFRKNQFATLVAMFTGTVFMVGLGSVIDHWGYGAWTFAPWNYFHYNLILGHVADVDTHPAWDFFRSSFTETFPPLGTVLLVTAVLTWISKPLHPITWGTFPLFLIHTIIGHKELRFLFPIAHAAPLLAVMFLDNGRISLSLNSGPRLHALGSISQLGSQLDLAHSLRTQSLCADPLHALPVWMPARFYEQAYPLPKDMRSLILSLKTRTPTKFWASPSIFIAHLISRKSTLPPLPSFKIALIKALSKIRCPSGSFK